MKKQAVAYKQKNETNEIKGGNHYTFKSKTVIFTKVQIGIILHKCIRDLNENVSVS